MNLFSVEVHDASRGCMALDIRVNEWPKASTPEALIRERCGEALAQLSWARIETKGDLTIADLSDYMIVVSESLLSAMSFVSVAFAATDGDDSIRPVYIKGRIFPYMSDEENK